MPIVYQTLPVATTEKGEPGGVATLDVNGKIPLSQLPPAVGGDGDVLSVNSIAPDENGDVYITTSVIPEGDDLYYTRARFDAAFAEEIAPTTQSISDLQNELNVTQTGSGLQTSGVYSPDLTTNYLTTASSLKDADKKLDTQVKTVADGLASEISNRAAADLAIEGEIDTLTADLSAVSSLVQNIKAGAGLSSTGTFVVKTTSNYLNTSTNIDQSTGLLDSALKAVSNRVGVLEADPVSKSYVDSGLALKADTTALTAETNRALGVEADLQDQIDDLVSADTNFALAAELNTTQTGAGLETNGTYSPDLTTNYLQTASSLKDADKKLDTQIKTVSDSLLSEISNRANADSALSDDISAEETRALAAEFSLQGQIDTIESSSGLGTDGSYAPPEGSQFLGSTTSLKSALAALDTNLATVFNDFNEHHLHNNSYFVNDGDSDIQTVHDLAGFGQGSVIYVGSGSYGGATLTLSKQNFAVQGPYVGPNNTICELAGGRGLTISGATCTRVRITNLQVEGALTLGTSEGRHIFTGCDFLGTTNISGVSNFITFTDCSFTGAITITNTVSATIYFVRCSFGGQLISSSVASPLQVILADCSGIHASQTNLVSKVALVGRTSYASGAVVQITNAANYVYDLVNGLSTTFSGAYSELRGKPTLVTASTGLSDSASLLRTSDLGTTVAPLSGGKIDMQYIPATVLTDVHVVADEAARLAIPDLVEGDYAIQTDDGSQWIYSGTTWYQVSSSTAGISTVNGKTGTSITLYTDDISEDGSPTNLWFTDARARTAAVVNSTDGSETNQASSVSATKSYISTQLGSYVQTSTYTAADVLTKIKTVDGSGSGLDADLLDGINSDAFVQTSGAQSIAGVKTFSDAPVVPDQNASDNSGKAANTKYVDAAITSIQNNLGASGQVVYKGDYNASTASPSLATAKKGYMYTISANGTLAGVSLTTADQILFAVDVSGGVVAAADFVVIDNTENPQTSSGNLPVVTLAADNATLVSNAYNLYASIGNWNSRIPAFANVNVGDVIYLRFRGANTLSIIRSATNYTANFFYAGTSSSNSLSLTQSGEYIFRCTGKNTSTNTLTFDVTVTNPKALRSTDDLAEGSTNLYYTDARSRSALSAGTGISYNSSTGVIANSAPYSDSSARSALSAGTGISYNSSTGVITNSAPYSDASARSALSAGTGISYNSSTGAISLNAGLGNLNGVSISGPQANQVLKYDGSNWVNAAQPSIYSDESARNAVGTAFESGNASNTGITFTNNDVANTITAVVSLGSFSVNALSDVDTTTTSPTVGQVLSWDGTNWKPSTVSGGGSGTGLLVQQSEAWTSNTISLITIYDDPNALPDEYYVFWRGTAAGSVVLPPPAANFVLKKVIVKNLTSQQLTIQCESGINGRFMYESDTPQSSIVLPSGYSGFSTTLICAKVATVAPGVLSYVWTVV